MVVRKLPMNPTKTVFEGITHWLHLADIPIAEIEGEILMLIGGF